MPDDETNESTPQETVDEAAEVFNSIMFGDDAPEPPQNSSNEED